MITTMESLDCDKADPGKVRVWFISALVHSFTAVATLRNGFGYGVRRWAKTRGVFIRLVNLDFPRVSWDCVVVPGPHHRYCATSMLKHFVLSHIWATDL